MKTKLWKKILNRYSIVYAQHYYSPLYEIEFPVIMIMDRKAHLQYWRIDSCLTKDEAYKLALDFLQKFLITKYRKHGKRRLALEKTKERIW